MTGPEETTEIQPGYEPSGEAEREINELLSRHKITEAFLAECSSIEEALFKRGVSVEEVREVYGDPIADDLAARYEKRHVNAKANSPAPVFEVDSPPTVESDANTGQLTEEVIQGQLQFFNTSPETNIAKGSLANTVRRHDTLPGDR